MSLLPEPITHRSLPEPDHPRLLQGDVSVAERRALWEVRAAQFRARELAGIVFGGVGESSLLAQRPDGPLRGLLRLDVPFADLDAHRDLEATFLSAVERDPLLSRIRLVYVLGPDVS